MNSLVVKMYHVAFCNCSVLCFIWFKSNNTSESTSSRQAVTFKLEISFIWLQRISSLSIPQIKVCEYTTACFCLASLQLTWKVDLTIHTWPWVNKSYWHHAKSHHAKNSYTLHSMNTWTLCTHLSGCYSESAHLHPALGLTYLLHPS